MLSEIDKQKVRKCIPYVVEDTNPFALCNHEVAKGACSIERQLFNGSPRWKRIHEIRVIVLIIIGIDGIWGYIVNTGVPTIVQYADERVIPDFHVISCSASIRGLSRQLETGDTMMGSSGWSFRVKSAFPLINCSSALRMWRDRDTDLIPIDNGPREGKGDSNEIIINGSTRRGGRLFICVSCNMCQNVTKLTGNIDTYLPF
jgi:hypothetical protein